PDSQNLLDSRAPVLLFQSPTRLIQSAPGKCSCAHSCAGRHISQARSPSPRLPAIRRRPLLSSILPGFRIPPSAVPVTLSPFSPLIGTTSAHRKCTDISRPDSNPPGTTSGKTLLPRPRPSGAPPAKPNAPGPGHRVAKSSPIFRPAKSKSNSGSSLRLASFFLNHLVFSRTSNSCRLPCGDKAHRHSEETAANPRFPLTAVAP